MHVGHVDLITKEKRANDNVLVIVSSSNTQKDRWTRTGLSLNRRFRNVREIFYDDEDVFLCGIIVNLRLLVHLYFHRKSSIYAGKSILVVN